MPTEKQQANQAHIAAAEAAGQPIAEYAREHNLNVQSLYGERHRQRRKVPKPVTSFVQVQRPVESVLPSALLQIRLPNGVSLALPTQDVPLAEILKTLARL